MLEIADPRPGEQVLELACGAARVGLEAARRVAPDGKVLCSDFAEAMVRAAEERIERLDLLSVAEARILDAQQLDLEDDSFDLVLCRFGYMLMADPSQALRESARVLRPGGRLVLSVWGPGERNPWISTIFDAVMVHLNAPPPEPGTPGPFALAEADRLLEMIGQAGLIEAGTAEITTRQTFDSPEDWWKQMGEMSGPLSALLASLPENDRQAIRAAALSAAEAFLEDGEDAVFPASVLGAQARKQG